MLRHVISLWETLSVELARQLYHTGQEPFVDIPSHYMNDISAQQVEELDKCLRKLDLNLLLGSLYDFIENHVKRVDANEEGWA